MTCFLTEGILDLNQWDLFLEGQFVGESELSHVTGPSGGQVILERDLGSPSALNPGNIGLSITSADPLGFTLSSQEGTKRLVLERGKVFLAISTLCRVPVQA